jgi:hypothetical protein
MNERIKELAFKAANGMLSFDAEGDWHLSESETEKFAVLVIAETTNWINENVGYVDASARVDLMKHFGVEE